MNRQPSRLKRNMSGWSRLSASQRGNVVIAIPVLCLVTMFGAWVWTRQSGLGLNQQIDHTKAIIAESNTLLLSLVDAETMIRGYDLTNDKAFLSPYNQSIAQFSESLARFNHLVDRDPARAEQVKSISQLAQQRLDILNRRLAALQAAGQASSQPNTSPSNTSASGDNRLLYEGKAV
ncbi:MAG TPA: CHASE3 domain-containing protein, partial [Allocoleopsis sp.]